MEERKSFIEWWRDDNFRSHLYYHLKQMIIGSIILAFLAWLPEKSEGAAFLTFISCFGMWKLGVVSEMLWKERKD